MNFTEDRRFRNVLLAGFAGLVLIAGCSQQPVVAEVQDRVYFDLATQQPITLPVQAASLPAEHPQTGKKTLVSALYCPQCDRWYPSPPMEVVQRTGAASRCPKGGHSMSPHGPRPNG